MGPVRPLCPQGFAAGRPILFGRTRHPAPRESARAHTGRILPPREAA